MSNEKIFVTSDWHFCHNKPFLYEPRGFQSIQDHNDTIIKNHNDLVTPEDEVYELGDQYLSSDEGLECIRELNGRIHCTIGNHTTDSRIEKLKSLPNIVEIQMGYRLRQGKWHFILSHYPQIITNQTPDKVIALCGHSHIQDPWFHWEYGVYHCELDCHNNKPITLDEILDDIRAKKSVASGAS